MPIPVTCQCGQSFAAGDHLAGRTVQCPKCKNPLAIPAAPVAAAAPRAAMPALGGAPNTIFDQAGMKTVATGMPVCPECSSEIQPGAVLCLNCGYHLQMKRRLGNQPRAGAGAGHGGHDAVAQDALARAAARIDEDKEAAKKEFKEGMPWWAMAGIFLFAVSFLVMMLMLPGKQAFLYGGCTIVAVSSMVSTYHGIRLLMIAFNDGAVHGLLYMFTGGVYALVYIIMHWDKCGSHFVWQLIMSLTIGIGVGMVVGSSYMSDEKTEPATMLPRDASWAYTLPRSELLPSVSDRLFL
jgi:hypothetical protein